MKSCSKVFVYQVCWPWIIFKWSWQADQKFQDEHFDHCPIYLVILQVISRNLVSNLCLELYIYILELYFIYRRVQIKIWWPSTRALWIWISQHDVIE
jgi:hypothetical protein